MGLRHAAVVTGNAAVTDRYRKAALLLESVAEEDRGWLLSQLADADRARLGPLFAELRGLGITLDPSMLRDFTSSLEQSRKLECARPEAMHRAIVDEPDWLVAVVLNARVWTWRGRLLRLLGRERASRVQALMARRPEPAPAALSALLARLEKRVADMSDTMPVAVPRFSWRKLVAWH